MDFGPMWNESLPNEERQLPVGVEILYQSEDVEALFHLVSFLIRKKSKEMELVLPSFIYRRMSAVEGKPMEVTGEVSANQIWDSINNNSENERRINGEVAVNFYDEMRPAFEAYRAELKAVHEEAQKSLEWSEAHPFFEVLLDYDYVAEYFFPPKNAMH